MVGVSNLYFALHVEILLCIIVPVLIYTVEEIFNLCCYLLSFQVHTTPEVDILNSTWSCKTALAIIGRRMSS